MFGRWNSLVQGLPAEKQEHTSLVGCGVFSFQIISSQFCDLKHLTVRLSGLPRNLAKKLAYAEAAPALVRRNILIHLNFSFEPTQFHKVD
jgi:hypothetical protein